MELSRETKGKYPTISNTAPFSHLLALHSQLIILGEHNVKSCS